MVPGVQLDRTNRRRRVRQKVHAPAYASFSGTSKGIMLDLHEILDISENGVAIQCASQLDARSSVTLCLDLSGGTGQIHATAVVAWSDGTGRAGLSLPNLPDSSLRQLREWLFFNAMVAAANSESPGAVAAEVSIENPRPDYTDTLTAVSAVQREVEALGTDLGAALQLVASRAHTLLRSSGAAIALATPDPAVFLCRASAGDSAPPVGAELRAGSGFSGECVRNGKILRCDDTEIDSRVDRESCRALSIRSIMAAPVRLGQKITGLIEVFSSRPGNFNDNDSAVLQRLADTVLAAVHRSSQADKPAAEASSPTLGPVQFQPAPGSVLFASEPKESKLDKSGTGETPSAGIRLPRSLLILLICAFAVICLAMGWVFAPWVQEQIRARAQHAEQTVFASSKSPSQPAAAPSGVSVETATLDQLQHLASQGDAKAENALGLRYATGDGVTLDEKQAARWFTSAAEHGNVAAQSKLGSLYWNGRGLPQSDNQAYFWTVLARAGGSDASKTMAPFIVARLTPAQRATIEKQAADWYSQHESSAKPSPAR